jgi:hypothetical protein
LDLGKKGFRLRNIILRAPQKKALTTLRQSALFIQ